MKRLILLRHAKSDWGGDTLDDHDRPLNDRGRKAAPRIGRWLRETGVLPDEVLCSTARRARETWDRLGLDGPLPHYVPELYLATSGRLLSALRSATGETVLILAHNPGIGAFAGRMAAMTPAHPDFARFPTAATAILEFDLNSWGKVRPAGGQVAHFVVPKDL